MSCRALHLSFCDGGYLYVHDEARVGRENHQIGWGRWRCEDAPFAESKLGGGAGDAKTPFTERPATYASEKSPGLSASKMVPSIIGEDLTIKGNVTSKGEIQVDGEIEGDIRCGSLLLGDKSKVTGGVAEDVVVRGHIVRSSGFRVRSRRNPMWKATFSIRALPSSGCLFRRKVAPLRRSARGRSRLRAQMAQRTWGPIPRVHRAWRHPPRRNSEGLSKGFCVVLLRCLSAARVAESFDGHLQGFLVGRKRRRTLTK